LRGVEAAGTVLPPSARLDLRDRRRAGARRIRLHVVRHTYSALSFDTVIEPKSLSDRVGHPNPAVTLQIYAHRSTG
jgi:integrase